MKKKGILLNGKNDYLSLPDTTDFRFSDTPIGFTVCLSYNFQKKEKKFWYCSCVEGEKCKLINRK